MFDTIAKWNGWDDEMAALQLFAHLEGDALNVALLIPEDQWVLQFSWEIGVLPGKVWSDEMKRSVFTTELEILAARGFGDVPGHQHCALRCHLDSVPPDTSIQDIVDRC